MRNLQIKYLQIVLNRNLYFKIIVQYFRNVILVI